MVVVLKQRGISELRDLPPQDWRDKLLQRGEEETCPNPPHPTQEPKGLEDTPPPHTTPNTHGNDDCDRVEGGINETHRIFGLSYHLGSSKGQTTHGRESDRDSNGPECKEPFKKILKREEGKGDEGLFFLCR